MRRREFVSGAAGALAWPLATRAQQPPIPVIGFLSATLPTDPQMLPAYRQGLSVAGYTEGRNVAIEYRSADSHYDRLPALAADLIERRVDLIAAFFTPVTARAARAATATIPIVFLYGGDPVEDGLVANLNRPGHNVTGVTFVTGALAAKRLELLRELVPKAAVIGVLINPTNLLGETQLRDLRAASRTLGQPIQVATASTEEELEGAFAALVQAGAGALLIGTDSFYFSRRNRIVALAVRHALPAIYAAGEWSKAGGLMSYGASQIDAANRAGIYSGRILKGEKPGDLPVQQSTKFELTINLKTASRLGISVPDHLLRRADEVVE